MESDAIQPAKLKFCAHLLLCYPCTTRAEVICECRHARQWIDIQYRKDMDTLNSAEIADLDRRIRAFLPLHKDVLEKGGKNPVHPKFGGIRLLPFLIKEFGTSPWTTVAQFEGEGKTERAGFRRRATAPPNASGQAAATAMLRAAQAVERDQPPPKRRKMTAARRALTSGCCEVGNFVGALSRSKMSMIKADQVRAGSGGYKGDVAEALGCLRYMDEAVHLENMLQTYERENNMKLGDTIKVVSGLAIPDVEDNVAVTLRGRPSITGRSKVSFLPLEYLSATGTVMSERPIL